MEDEKIVTIETILSQSPSVSKKCQDCEKGWLLDASVIECPKCGGELRPAELVYGVRRGIRR